MHAEQDERLGAAFIKTLRTNDASPLHEFIVAEKDIHPIEAFAITVLQASFLQGLTLKTLDTPERQLELSSHLKTVFDISRQNRNRTPGTRLEAYITLKNEKSE